jgi:hypothetical protein
MDKSCPIKHTHTHTHTYAYMFTDEHKQKLKEIIMEWLNGLTANFYNEVIVMLVKHLDR